jgi:hypothetical protein
MTRRRARLPTIETRFHIDPGWWERMGRDFRVYLHGALCPACREELSPTNSNLREVDYVDPQTAEVRRINELWARLLSHCSQQPDYVEPNTPLTAAIFRTLLASGNRPMSPKELHRRIGKSDPRTILRILTGRTHYGILPAE